MTDAYVLSLLFALAFDRVYDIVREPMAAKGVIPSRPSRTQVN